MRTSIVALGAAVLAIAALAGVRAGAFEPVQQEEVEESARGGSGAEAKATAPKPMRVVKSNAEWRKQLSDLEYYVTRRKGTEQAFTGRYWNHHGDGIYRCVCCETPLFDSKAKFESGTGWPSFFAPIGKGVVKTEVDRSNFQIRTEVLCRVCNAHLGHVFRDGPRPTGLRFCMNSASLTFQDRAAAEAEAAARAVLESDPQPEAGAGEEEADGPGPGPEEGPAPGR
ncbi:Peptide methionine sulfoxide reductase MsrB [Tautonia plasticadhaerens]|uniref:peptide-methionine (R)-S-oxide reductase n=1 Tax=Tautonia plasticadhaerens TaxID=2527974 RepID=A0A518GUX9_9BACT|nr:peptide-methionine (R)-S-oxide reductase MsrB [Tautonia plasticadhaerens]QDV32386.1 Peptide methionine sulfoxide reductase MsrB [Tautonia plasticadhaerens]